MEDLYYNPKTGLRSSNALYEQTKKNNINTTHSIINKFVNNQEVDQVFRSSHPMYYPLYATKPFERVQIDLADFRNEVPRLNSNYKWIFVCVDVFSRTAIALPMKDKSNSSVMKTFKKIIVILNICPRQLDSDNEASFTSNDFKKFCRDNNIKQNLNTPGDFKSKGIVEAFIKTLRRQIAKYQLSEKTNNWINGLQDIIYGYNHTKHSFLKATPIEAMENPNYYWDAYDKQVTKTEQSKAYQQDLKVGDKVRIMIHRELFDKGSSKPRFSKQIHTIEEINKPYYIVNNRRHQYKIYELMKVETVEINPHIRSTFLESLSNNTQYRDESRMREISRRNQQIRRRISREGI